MESQESKHSANDNDPKPLQAMPPARSTRKRARVNYNEDAWKTEAKKKRTAQRSPRARRTPATKKQPQSIASSVHDDDDNDDKHEDIPVPTVKKDDVDKDEHNDAPVLTVKQEADLDDGNTSVQKGNDDRDEEQPEEEEDEEEKIVKKRRTKSSKRKGRGPITERTCPHCDKLCVSKTGLKYHIDHFVCRSELKLTESTTTTPSSERQRSTTQSENSNVKKTKRNTKQSNRDRGSTKDRTCPECKRVFTSMLGRNYHVDHKVCASGTTARNTMGSQQLFDTLLPGSKYVTPFGVVEVIADNRATPVDTPKATKREQRQLLKAHLTARKKAMIHQTRICTNVAVQSRVRRERLLRLFLQFGARMDQIAVWKVYFGGDPCNIPKVDKAMAPIVQKWIEPRDPFFPKDSYPDRIVECRLIPDERGVLLDFDYDVTLSSNEDAPPPTKKPRLETSEILAPGSATGCQMTLYIQRRMFTEEYNPLLIQYPCPDCGQKFSSQSGRLYHVQAQVCKNKTRARVEQLHQLLASVDERAERQLTRRHRTIKAKPNAVYPQVWISLGFIFVAKPVAKGEDVSDAAEDKHDSIMPLENELQRLRIELMKEEDRKLGAMYPGVFEALKFELPRPKWKPPKEKKKKKPVELKKPAPPAKPPPAIIDVRVLADEVDCGRYPSIRRYYGDHDDICFICRNGGQLFCCDFCRKAVHFGCILQKHTIKDPEPEDDFMCHRCIQYIMARRTRAEKRRIMKQRAALKRAILGIHEEETPMSSTAVSIVQGTDNGGGESDYHKVASMGKGLNELMELLQDAQTRLRQSMRVNKMNDIRRSLFEPSQIDLSHDLMHQENYKNQDS